MPPIIAFIAMETPMTPTASSVTAPPDCSVVELRQYTLHPGQRDRLIGLFEREFIEPQEALGLKVLGQFRDLDDADRFVWLRGFADMASRPASLGAFYGGPIWQAHRDAANATMIDSDDVLLLRPAWPGAGLAAPGRRVAAPAGTCAVHVHPLAAPASGDLLALCRHTLARQLADAGALEQAWFVTDATPNNFPALPVREGESVLVCVAIFADLAALDAWAGFGPALAPWLARPTQQLRLLPTPRSALHA